MDPAKRDCSAVFRCLPWWGIYVTDQVLGPAETNQKWILCLEIGIQLLYFSCFSDSLAFKDRFILMLQCHMTLFLKRQDYYWIKHLHLPGFFVVWRSDRPSGISVTNASSPSLKSKTNVVGFFPFHLAAMFLQRKHLSVSLSPSLFLTMTEAVIVRLKKHPFTQLHTSLRHGRSHLKLQSGNEERQSSLGTEFFL